MSDTSGMGGVRDVGDVRQAGDPPDVRDAGGRTVRLATALELDAGAVAPGLAGVPADYPVRRPLLEHGRLRRRRAWGVAGAESAVAAGDRVGPADVVARYPAVGRAAAIDVAAGLGVPPERAAASLVHAAGEMVAEGDVLAERRLLGGLQRRTVRSPATGTLTHVSVESGTVYVEPVPATAGIAAHLGGTVVDADETAVTIEGDALAVAGVAGAGAAACGTLHVISTPADVPADAAGVVLACAFVLDEAALQRIIAAGAAAIVAADVEPLASERLGWDDLLWPRPAGGHERPTPPVTIVVLAASAGAQSASVTGQLGAVWDLLRRCGGRTASALGAEAGSGPELLVALDDGDAAGAVKAAPTTTELRVGRRVRVTDGRAEGLEGTIADVYDAPYRLASEVLASVADVELPYDVRLRLPLTHLEALPEANTGA